MTTKAENIINWFEHKRIRRWYSKELRIMWVKTFKNLNRTDKPLSRYTSPKESNIKNFKVKLIMEELPNYENLYIRDKIKYISSECRRYNTTIEDNTHWLFCIKNIVKIDNIIKEAILEIEIEKDIKTKFLNSNKNVATRMTNKLHHKTIVKIKEKIWLQSKIELQEYPISMISQSINTENLEDIAEKEENYINNNIRKWGELF
ncbi:12178_t:CDS:2, partial [Dentiscutata erythropus]